MPSYKYMELLLLGGLAGLGYKIANAVPPASAPASLPSRTAQDKLQAMYSKSYQDMLNPLDTGIVPPNTKLGPCMGLPYNPSTRTQSTNTAYKQRTVELFTGKDPCKIEKASTAPLFNPAATAQPVTSLGTTGNAYARPDADRYFAGNKQNGVGPCDRIQVGPALGVGPDVQSAGGFHPYLRILPKNVNEHLVHRGKQAGRYISMGGSDGRTLTAPPLMPNTDSNRQSMRPDLHRTRDLLPMGTTEAQASSTRPLYSTKTLADGLPSSDPRFGPATGPSVIHGMASGDTPSITQANTRIQARPHGQHLEPIVLNVRGGNEGSYSQLGQIQEPFRQQPQQLPVTNVAGAGASYNIDGRQQQANANSLRPTLRNGVSLPTTMPASQHVASEVRRDDLWMHQTKPGKQVLEARNAGNPALGGSGGTVPTALNIRSDRPVVSYTPGAQNSAGGPIGLGTSVRDKLGGREVQGVPYQIGVRQGGSSNPSGYNPVAARHLQGQQECRGREVWSRPVAPGGGLLAA